MSWPWVVAVLEGRGLCILTSPLRTKQVGPEGGERSRAQALLLSGRRPWSVYLFT